MIKYMQYEEYESKVRIFHRERVERFHFNFSLVNQIHREGEYIHDKWVSFSFFLSLPALTVVFKTNLKPNQALICHFFNGELRNLSH